LPESVPAFDARAADYDSRFTATAIGTMMRGAVRVRCAARFQPGMHVLEMNCGTGDDALWLARRGIKVTATDISSAMLAVAENKRGLSPDAQSVQFRALAWEDLQAFPDGPFDGALSNFGGLNCVADLKGAAHALAGKLRSGATALLCIMGPVVPWEWVWFLAQGKPAAAFRRLQRGGVQWRDIRVHYPSIAETRRAFAPQFHLRRQSAIGALLPPPYTEERFARFPRALAALGGIERRFETVWPLPLLADHYLLEMERV
jgi:SAM-dependent methyltransferase